MQTQILQLNSKPMVKNAIFDLFAVLFIYLVPTFSHLLSIPLYLFEPMRIMLILSIAHTSRKNAYIIALTLPLFSFIISSHPVFLKSILIAGELILNIWLFFYLSSRIGRYAAAVTAILASKLVYYIAKFALISFALIDSELFSTPVVLQLSMTVIFATYLWLAGHKNA